MVTRKTTVIELHEVTVEPPLTDGAGARAHRLGVFSSFETASTWLQTRVVKKTGKESDDDYALLSYTADEVVVDYRERFCRSVVYDRDGSVRGVNPGGGMRPWGGRDPETCRFKLGQIVGFVDGEVYKLGVVNGLPVTPHEASHWSGVTLGDDLYLVGVLNKDGGANTNDHEHVHESELFVVEHEVAPEVREALKMRHRGYEE